MKKKSVLVTGGCGFIGANLVRSLLKENYQVHLIVRSESNFSRLNDVISQVIIHQVDLENMDELKRVVNQVKPSLIFHLAAHGVITRDTSSKMLSSNIIGTYNLLIATQDLEYKFFLHLGSSTEYGKKNAPMRETDYLKPDTFFGCSKACGTMLVQEFALEYRKPICILRPFSVYGPYESSRRFIPTLIEAAYAGKKVALTSPGFSRDYIFIDDVVRACLLCAKVRPKGEIINIGSGIQTTNEGVVELLEELTQKKIEVEVGAFPKRLTDTKFWVSDSSKARKILNWEPQYELRKGLQKMIDRYAATFN